MNIFFIGSIRGGRAQQPGYAHIVDVLERYGNVSPQHVSDDTLSEFGETNLSAEEILEREQKTLETSDVVVAEVTTPSLGVGYLVAHARSLGKRVIALYNGEDTLKLSAIIKGDAGVELHTYVREQELDTILEEALAN